MELGTSTLTRRERIERIAMAERDRRAGRCEVAIATLGEASEWPARVVLALARMGESEAVETRRILEEGLDLWAREAGLAPLDEVDQQTVAAPARELERPIDHGELERAFAEAEAQTDQMHGANDVAERILMNEPVGLAELDGNEWVGGFADAESAATDAALVEPAVMGPIEDAASADPDSPTNRAQVLATLERWLRNLQGRDAGRAR